MTPAARRVAPAGVPGLTARRIAADILDNVLRRRRPLDAELDGAEAHPGLAALADRDRAADRRRTASLSRRAGPCGGRPLGAAGAGRPARREISGTDQRGAAARGARRPGSD